MFVALDLETTGLDPKNDRIIEVAVLRISPEGTILEEFHSLVQPGVTLPQLITHLTGITDEDLKDAPSWTSLQKQVEAFIGDAPVLGHSVQFDIDFLTNGGLTLTNTVLDTFELAQTLLPHERSYSLEILSEKYQLPHPNKHRAIDDTRVAVELYKFLKETIQNLSSPHAKKIIEILGKSTWGWQGLFKEHLKEGPRLPAKKEKNFSAAPHPSTILQELLVQKLLNHESAIIEVPYHLSHEWISAAAEAFEHSGEKILIATGTPEGITADPRVAVLHHPAKYLCKERFETFLKKSDFTNPEARLLTKILLWETETGFKHEINVGDTEQATWSELSAYPHLYTDTCRDPDCYYRQARLEADRKGVLVIGHDLLVENIVEQHALLPQRETLLLDTLENFEHTATETFTRYFTPEGLIAYAPASLENRLTIVFGILGLMAEKYAPPDAFRTQLILTSALVPSKKWQQLQAALDNIATEIQQWPEKEQRSSVMFVRKFKALQKALNLNASVLTWVAPRMDGTPVVRGCPIDVSGLLKQELWSRFPTLLLLSPCGMLDNKFAFLKERLALPAELPEKTLKKDPQIHSIGLIPHPEMSDPKSPRNLSQTAEFIRHWFESQEKNHERPVAFILTNSIKASEQLHHQLAGFFKEKGKDLLTQGMSGGIGKTIQRFERDPESVVLMGTEKLYHAVTHCPSSEKLTTLFIQRLPFLPPSHPVHEEQCKRLENGFGQYSLPKAVLRMKQFIYTFVGQGNAREIHILDPRFEQYNGLFVRSLQELIE
jgi:DNA polymerase III epsilon subunit family exonuclease